MTQVKRNRALYLAAMGTLAVAAGSVRAASLSWDPAHAGTAAGSGGSGIWDNGTTGNWSTGSGDTTWNSATPDTATFATTTGTVTLSGGAITASSMTLNTNYTFNLGGNNLVSTGGILGSSTSSVFTNTSVAAATLTTGSFAQNGTRVTGNVALVFGANWTPNATNDFTGIAWWKPTAASTLQIGSQSNLGSATGTMRFDASGSSGAITLKFSPPVKTYTYTRDIEIVQGAGASVVNFATNGSQDVTLAGNISNNITDSSLGFLISGNAQGNIVLAGNNTFGGLIRMDGQSNTITFASNNAMGNATGVSMNVGNALQTIAFRGGITLANQTAVIDITNGATNTAASGMGLIQNQSGNNVVNNTILWTSSTNRYIGVDARSMLTLNGVMGSAALAAGITKIGYGTLVLTGAEQFGTYNGNGASTDATQIKEGTLRLDFANSAVVKNIINNGLVTDVSASTNGVSHLILAGGTLEVIGKANTANEQYFKNTNDDNLPPSTNTFALGAGASAVRVTSGAGGSVTLGLGKLLASQRAIGSSIDFTLPTAGAVLLQNSGTAGGVVAVGTNNTLITANGVAFATVDGTDWAALDNGNRKVIRGSDVTGGGFYTTSDGVSLAGNADMANNTDTVLSADTNITSLRFHNAGTRNLNLGGTILTTGGILVTNTGNGATSIGGGTLRGQATTVASANQELQIHQYNTAGALTIGATIANNTTGTTAATALTKIGDGELILTAANTYTGETHLNGGVTRLTGSGAINSNSKIVFQGGVLGLDAGVTFNRTLGTGATNVQFFGGGGFAAYGGTATVNFGGAGADFALGNFTAGGVDTTVLPYNSPLILGASDATGTIVLSNPLKLFGPNAPEIHEIRVIRGSNTGLDVDARISFSSAVRDGGWRKTGDGTVEVVNSIGAYTGVTIIEAGKVKLGAATALPSVNTVTVKAGTLDLATFNYSTVSFAGNYGLLMGGGASGTTSLITGSSGTLTLNTDVSYVGTVDSGATLGGNVTTTAVRSFNVADSSGATVDLDVSATFTGSGGGISKTGNGLMRLSGTSSYSGATNVNAGTLQVTGALNSTGTIAVNSGGTLQMAGGSIGSSSNLTVNSGGLLKGTGTISRAITVASGGKINPGATTAGTLTTAGLTLASGSKTDLDINSDQAGGNFDRIISSGTVSYGGTLEVSFSQNFGTGVSWDLVDLTGSSGAFTSIVDLSNTYQSSQLSFDSASGVLSVADVPEPASLGLVLAGAGLMLRRRRRAQS